MSDSPQKQIVIVQSTKNPGVAALLAFIFGPLGLLYVGWVPALIMFVICVPLVLLTAGFSLIITAPVCAVIGYTRTNAFNKQLLEANR
jgi:hypothetical protein